MSTLSEQIEALQAKWMACGKAHPQLDELYYAHADSLRPILVAAREHEKELAELNAHKMKWENKDGTLTDYAYLVKLEKELAAIKGERDQIRATANALAEEREILERAAEQHSADLREIAEMAIAKCEAKYLPAIKYMYDNSGLCAEMGCGCEASQVIAPVLWADMRKELFNVEDILREFREKKGVRK